MAGKRENLSSGSVFEENFGYSRAVKVGDMVFISGTVGIDYKTGAVSSDPHEQLRQIVRNFQPSLEKAGAKMADIVQITTYVTEPEVFHELGPTLKEIFGSIKPSNAALVVAFPVPDVVVEISATAIVGAGG